MKQAQPSKFTYSPSWGFQMQHLLRSPSLRKTLIALKTLIKRIQNLFFFFFTMNSSATPVEPNTNSDPFDPSIPSLPVSFPITKIEDLKSRSYFDSFHYPFNRSSVSLPPLTLSMPPRPRMLVCHDMAGGYIDDKWVQGGTNADAYAIWHWYLIDVFVYFSHNLVTIPPPCWTNTAHEHGVKVLGTFIMEWDEGKIISKELLSTKESSQMYAERLTELAVALGFDGWLINMEVQLDLEQIPNLKEFVSHLTQTMHSSMPGSLVIWYDSVTKDGSLNWQNQLNEENKPFFDLCDGIYVNYTWLEDYPKLSAAVAGERKFDVYMGIDVFGRNTYGGGQWTTNVALDLLKKDDVSAAIFAPGWVYETKQPPDFQTAQNRWWGLVEKSWGINQNYPKVLPFYSNFDQGRGYHISVEGSKVSDDPWCNISCQTFQPILDNSTDSTESPIQVFENFKDTSYSGGGSITFKGSLEKHASFTTRLFQGELPLEDLPVHILYSVKLEGSSLLGISLGFSSNIQGNASILLASKGKTFPPSDQLTKKFDKVMPLQVRKLERENQQATEWILQETSINMNGYTLTDIYVVCYMQGKIELSKHIADEVPKLEYNASLGHICIRTTEQTTKLPPSTAWAVEGQNISWASSSQGTKMVSVKVVWKLKDSPGGDNWSFLKYNIYVEKLIKSARKDLGGMIADAEEYLGVARVEAFYVSELVVPPGIVGLKFIIQVCGIDGSFQKLDDAPAYLLDVQGLSGVQPSFENEHGMVGDGTKSKLLDETSEYVLTYEGIERDWILVGYVHREKVDI